MQLKLRVEEPGGTGYRTIASQRGIDPTDGSGWYVGRRDGCIIMGKGIALDGNEVWASDFGSGEFLIEWEGDSLAVYWGETFASCTMPGIDPGTELHVGKDPQLPASKWHGKIDVIED